MEKLLLKLDFNIVTACYFLTDTICSSETIYWFPDFQQLFVPGNKYLICFLLNPFSLIIPRTLVIRTFLLITLWFPAKLIFNISTSPSFDAKNNFIFLPISDKLVQKWQCQVVHIRWNCDQRQFSKTHFENWKIKI